MPRRRLLADARDARVLLIEDEDELRLVLAEVLERHGFRVEGVSNGTDAISRARGGAPAPDLVLMDWNVPGIAGNDLLACLRDIWPFTALVVLSGQPRPELRLRSPVPVPVLQKPIPMRALVDTLLQIINDVDTADEPRPAPGPGPGGAAAIRPPAGS
ncbi:MAG: response regulator [Deltaproteobacteria bacterium]|nr:response regulator [Deltaproteobacteria bacterium]